MDTERKLVDLLAAGHALAESLAPLMEADPLGIGDTPSVVTALDGWRSAVARPTTGLAGP